MTASRPIPTANPATPAVRGLTPAELKAQGERCPCNGADDYCVCQNVPDAVTAREWGLHASDKSEWGRVLPTDPVEKKYRDLYREFGRLQRQIRQSIASRYGDIQYGHPTAASLGLSDLRINFAIYNGPVICTPGYNGAPSDFIASIHGRDGTRERMDRAYFIANAINFHDELVALVDCLIRNDPNEDAAYEDAADGVTVLDVWRHDAKVLLKRIGFEQKPLVNEDAP